MVPPPNPSPTFFIHPILFLIVSMFLCSWIFGIVLNNYNESLKEDWIKIWMNSDGLGYIWTMPPIFFFQVDIMWIHARVSWLILRAKVGRIHEYS